MVGLLSLLPLIAWYHVDHSDREVREQIVQDFRERTTGIRAGSSNAARLSPVPTLTGSVQSDACTPFASAAGVCRASLGVVPGAYPTPLSNAVGVNLAPVLSRTSWNPVPLVSAAAAYLVVAVAALLILFWTLRRLARFHDAVHEVVLGRLTDRPLAERTELAELAGVARCLDRLMFDLSYAVGQMRTASDDNAHSMRTPIATAQTALFTVKRHIAESTPRAQRAVAAIELSIDRLYFLVDAAQGNGQAVAALVAAPRRRVELAAIVKAAVAQSMEKARARGVRIVELKQRPVFSQANPAALEAAIRDALLGVVESCSIGRHVRLTLSSDGRAASLLMESADFQDLDSGSLLESAAASPTGSASSGFPSDLSEAWRLIESLGGEASAWRHARGDRSVLLILPADPSRHGRIAAWLRRAGTPTVSSQRRSGRDESRGERR